MPKTTTYPKGEVLQNPYQITSYTKQQAQKLGVTVASSSNPKKKLDVFDNGKKIASVGAVGYKDYPTYLKENGKKVADEHRRLYNIRHQKDREKKGTPGFYASKLLW